MLTDYQGGLKSH